ncbi:MAG: PDZ domain-containing protein [Gemmatimonadaceae bacterium]
MRIHTRILSALLAAASTLGAQGAPSCIRHSQSNTPIIVNGQPVGDTIELTASTGNGFLATDGAAFGITGYRCPACEMRRKPGQAPETSFLAEPVVESVSGATPVKPGDIVEAVNGQPITSSAGSKQFTRPTGGATTLTVRRGRDRLVLSFTVAPPCPDSLRISMSGFVRDGRLIRNDSVIALRAQLSGKVTGDPVYVIDGVVVSPPIPRGNAIGPIYVIDGVRYDPSASVPATHFGFALSCTGDCGQITLPDGTTYFQYSAAPKVSEIREVGVAASAGLRVGDVVVKVDGHSILDDEGALALARAEQNDSVRLTVLRHGKEVDIVLQAVMKPSLGFTRRP